MVNCCKDLEEFVGSRVVECDDRSCFFAFLERFEKIYDPGHGRSKLKPQG